MKWRVGHVVLLQIRLFNHLLDVLAGCRLSDKMTLGNSCEVHLYADSGHSLTTDGVSHVLQRHELSERVMAEPKIVWGAELSWVDVDHNTLNV